MLPRINITLSVVPSHKNELLSSPILFSHADMKLELIHISNVPTRISLICNRFYNYLQCLLNTLSHMTRYRQCKAYGVSYPQSIDTTDKEIINIFLSSMN